MSRSIALVTAVALSTVIGSACRRAAEPPKAETPSLNVTNWTEKTELYMEYPPLVAGRTARFAVHLTRLADFQASRQVARDSSSRQKPEVLRRRSLDRNRRDPARFASRARRRQRDAIAGRSRSRPPDCPTGTTWVR